MKKDTHPNKSDYCLNFIRERYQVCETPEQEGVLRRKIYGELLDCINISVVYCAYWYFKVRSEKLTELNESLVNNTKIV